MTRNPKLNKVTKDKIEDQLAPPAPTTQLSFDSVKVFSATKHIDRNYLGDTITDWLRAHPGIEIVDKIVKQSSDNEFHCLSITFFYRSAT